MIRDYRVQSATAIGLTPEQRRGLVFYSERQRSILVEFETPQDAQAWDAMDEDEAFAVLAAAAASRRADKERGT